MRDFFEQQDTAKRISWQYAVVLALTLPGTIAATALVFAGLTTMFALLQAATTVDLPMDPEYWLKQFFNQLLMAVALAAAIVIGFAVQRTMQVQSLGGLELARQWGGTRVHAIDEDPQHRQLINVVEELSISANVSVPKIFVLEEETSINAFAAGMEPRDTVVGVTRGALERLNRDQLQGVLAHEFSHLVNGDVRINVLALGALQGVEAVASVSNYLLGMGIGSGVYGSSMATIFGYALWPVGQIGVLFASLARMALNRQREFLADAAAVEFTRYPEGLSSALKLIAADPRQAQVDSRAAQIASHLFFADGMEESRLSSHPPLDARIRRLDPEWDGVLPVAPPPEAEAPLVDDRVTGPSRGAEAVIPPLPGTAWVPDDDESAAVELALQTATVTRSVATSQADSGEAPEEVLDPNEMAFLETLARVKSTGSQSSYDPQMTHWPTLAATAAVIAAASLLFRWFIG